MKKIKKFDLKIKDGYLYWVEKNHSEIRDGISMAEAGTLILAQKVNELIDEVNRLKQMHAN